MTPDVTNPQSPDSVKRLVEQINALAEKVTPGPWERDFDTRYERHDRATYKEHFLTASARNYVALASADDATELTQDDEGRLEDLQSRADLEFIAALVNAWPAITSALESAERRAEALEQALRELHTRADAMDAAARSLTPTDGGKT